MRNLYGFLNGIINNFCIFIEIYIIYFLIKKILKKKSILLKVISNI